MYLEFESLGFSKFLSFPDGSPKKLSLMTEPMGEYIKKGKKDEFLALTIFLFEKGFSTQELYDNMLNIILHIDSTNLIANYELAKLRYNEGYLGLTHFLIARSCQMFPKNDEVKKIKNEIERKYGKDTYDKTMNYNEYLDLNPHYINQ